MLNHRRAPNNNAPNQLQRLRLHANFCASLSGTCPNSYRMWEVVDDVSEIHYKDIAFQDEENREHV